VNPFWIWFAAALVYGVFTFWYHNWSGPLGPEEIDTYLARLAERPEAPDGDRLAALRRFLEADDGGEFFMVNLIRLKGDPVADPETGTPRSAAELLRRYTGAFMPRVILRAGHPTFFGRAAGRYLEQWGVEPDPGWTLAGIVRYRSRRDLMELVTDPRFDPDHVFKVAALSHTLAFPAAPATVVVGPRVTVALLLGLAGALGHLAFGTR